MRPTIELTIKADYEGDHTESWGNARHPDIFPSVYQRYRAPQTPSECKRMVDDLTALVSEISDSYEQTRQNAINLGINPLHDTATKDSLKRIKNARFRNEAIRRAYIHWLTVQTGDASGLPVLGRTQLGKAARLDLLAASVIRLCDLYEADVKEQIKTDDLLAELDGLRTQLKAFFNG